MTHSIHMAISFILTLILIGPLASANLSYGKKTSLTSILAWTVSHSILHHGAVLKYRLYNIALKLAFKCRKHGSSFEVNKGISRKMFSCSVSWPSNAVLKAVHCFNCLNIECFIEICVVERCGSLFEFGFCCRFLPLL